VRLVVTEATEAVVEALRGVEGVASVERIGPLALKVSSPAAPETVNPRIARAVLEAGAGLVAMEPETADLKDVYLRVVREAGA
jgi:hypothetical protein